MPYRRVCQTAKRAKLILYNGGVFEIRRFRHILTDSFYKAKELNVPEDRRNAGIHPYGRERGGGLSFVCLFFCWELVGEESFRTGHPTIP